MYAFFSRHKHVYLYCAHLDWAFVASAFVIFTFRSFFLFFFLFSRVLEYAATVHWTVAANVDFSTVNSASVHCSWTHKFHFSVTFSLQMGPIALFTYLKIILLFSVFNFQFQQNKFYPNRPISYYIMQFSISKHTYIWYDQITILLLVYFYFVDI